MQSGNSVMELLDKVMHPEIGRSLVELRMIKSARVKDGRVQVTLAVPFQEIPIKEELVQRLRGALEEMGNGPEVDVEVVEMSQRERADFMAASEKEESLVRSFNRIDRVITVLSGKGGVGKSSVTALLAVALNRRGARVGVLDADVTGPSQPRLFGVSKPPAASPSGMVPPMTKTGIKLISINLLLASEDQAVIWRGPLISNVIKQFWNQVVWGELDYLIVDLPPGTSDASLTVMQSIPLSGVVLVTSPQDLAGMVVRKAAGMVTGLGAPIIGLIENMSYVVCPACGRHIEAFGPSMADHTATVLGLPVLGRLPLEPSLAIHCDAGQIEDYAAESFDPIAQMIVEGAAVREELAAAATGSTG